MMNHDTNTTQGGTAPDWNGALQQLLGEVRLMRSENAALREANEETKSKLAALETFVRSAQATPAPTPAPEDSETTPTPTPTRHPESSHRLRPRFPDPTLFEGQKSIWRGWKLEIEGKLIEDAEALGSNTSQLRYVYSRLAGKAKENITTFVKTTTR